jgi:hypothetical protein
VKAPERNELVSTEIKSDQTAEDVRLLQQAIGEVDRYRSMDRLIPSAHNVVTIAAIDVSVLPPDTALCTYGMIVVVLCNAQRSGPHS